MAELLNRFEVAAALRVVAQLVNADAIENDRFVQEVSEEVFGWIDDLKVEYPGVDSKRVREIYGRQLTTGEVPIDRSAVEDVFIGVALGVYESEGTGVKE